MATSQDPGRPGGGPGGIERPLLITLLGAGAALLSVVAAGGVLLANSKVLLGTEESASKGWLYFLLLFLVLVVPAVLFAANRLTPAGLDLRTRVFVGGVAGVLLLLLSFLMVVYGYQIFLGGLPEWRKSWMFVGLFVVTQIAGLGVLFGSLTLARAEERTDPVLRRLLY